MTSTSSTAFVSLLALLALSLAAGVSAEENHMELGPASSPEAGPAPLRMVEKSGIGPAFVLEAADKAAVRPISAWNAAGNLPLRNGIVRSLPESRTVVLSRLKSGAIHRSSGGTVVARSSTDDATVWGMSIRTENAWRTRVRLDDVRLPAGAQIWVYGEDGETVGPFGTELRAPDGSIWTPSVGGAEIRLEISVPDAAWDEEYPPSLKITSIAELFPLDELGLPQLGGEIQPKDLSCLVDAPCATSVDFSSIDFANRAVAHLQFMVGNDGFICTGTLVNDKMTSTFVPYLLTANHCFSTQASASSLDAFFDYINNSCNGSTPSLGSLPRSSGSTLLATNTASDFTFVRLNSLPGSRVLMGWTTAEPAVGTALHRVAHPQGLPASYSQVDKAPDPFDTCSLGATHYHFTNPTVGTTSGGSSGSALMQDNGQIVGQLRGVCGPNIEDDCDYDNDQVDGKFASAFPQISQYINDDGSGGNGPCVQDLNNGVVCLRSGRFEFTGTWTSFDNPPVVQPLIWTPVEDINATAGFQNNPSGIQVVMRVANGCTQTGTWWIWLGGFTGAGWDITVRDTVTGAQNLYSKARDGSLLPTTTRDNTTFPCN
jgi:hypothetical protein